MKLKATSYIAFEKDQNSCVSPGGGGGKPKYVHPISSNVHHRLSEKTCLNRGVLTQTMYPLPQPEIPVRVRLRCKLLTFLLVFKLQEVIPCLNKTSRFKFLTDA